MCFELRASQEMCFQYGYFFIFSLISFRNGTSNVQSGTDGETYLRDYSIKWFNHILLIVSNKINKTTHSLSSVLQKHNVPVSIVRTKIDQVKFQNRVVFFSQIRGENLIL